MAFKFFYLQTIHDSHVSFGGKAVVEQTLDGAILYSYGTRVAEYIHVEEGLDMLKIYGLYSNTTIRHIREFCLQVGAGWLSSSEMSDIIEERGVYL